MVVEPWTMHSQLKALDATLLMFLVFLWARCPFPKMVLIDRYVRSSAAPNEANASSCFVLPYVYRGETKHTVVKFDNLHLLCQCSDSLQTFFDAFVLQDGRRAKLLDASLTHVRRVRSLDDSALAYELESILGHLKIISEDESQTLISYEDFQDALNTAVRTSLYGLNAIFIDEQSALEQNMLNVKKLPIQQRQQSRKELDRIKREMVQRDVAAALKRAERDKVPVNERDKRRTLARKAARKIKDAVRRNTITEQSGVLAGLAIGVATHSVLRLSRSVTRTLRKVDTMIDDQRTQDIVTNTAKLSNTATEVLGVLDIKNMISEAINSFMASVSKVPEIIKNVLLAAFMYHLVVTFEAPVVRIALISLSGLYFRGIILDLMREYFQKAHEEDTEVKPQSGIYVNTSFISKIIGTCVVATFMKTARANTRADAIKHLALVLGSAPRMFSGIEQLIDTMLTLTEKAINALNSWFDRPSIRFARNIERQLDGLVDEVHEFQQAMAANKTGMTAHQQYAKLLSFITRVDTQYNIHASNRDLRSILQELKRSLQAAAHPLRQSVGAGMGYRQQPASLMISGKPGVGKTSMTQAIALAILRAAGHRSAQSAMEASQDIFVKPPNSDYFDGYVGQATYLIDDFAAVKAVAGDAKEFADVMGFYGSYTTMLNMAELEKKGMFPFTSKLILMTTNVTSLDETTISEVLNFPDAFKRRIDFNVELRVKPEFCRERPDGTLSHELDFDKFDEEQLKQPAKGLLAYPWHVWEYFDVDFGVSRDFTPGTGKPLLELIQRVGDRIRRNERIHNSNMDLLDRMIDDAEEDGIEQQSGGGPEPDLSMISKRRYKAYYNDLVKWFKYKKTLEPFAPESMSAEECSEAYRKAKVQAEEELESEKREKMVETALECQDPVIMERSQIDTLMEGFRNNVRAAYIAGSGNRDLSFVKIALLTAAGWVTLRKLVIPLLKGVIFGLVLSLRSLFGLNRKGKKKKNKSKIVQQSNGPQFKKTVKFSEQGAAVARPPWKKIYDNTYKILLDPGIGSEYVVLGQTLFIKGGISVMPYHFIQTMKDKIEEGALSKENMLYFRGCNKPGESIKSPCTTFQMSVGVFLKLNRYDIPDDDLAFVEFGRDVRPMADISKFLLSEKSIRDSTGQRVRLDTARVDEFGDLVDYNTRVTFMDESVLVGRAPIEVGRGKFRKRYLRYHADTIKGDCGAVLCLYDGSATKNAIILGLHMAKNDSTGHGYATMLSREDWMKALDRLTTKDLPALTAEESGWSDIGAIVEQSDEVYIPEELKNFEPVGVTSKPVATPTMTSLRKTTFGESQFFINEIALLNEGKDVEPLELMKLYPHWKDGERVLPMVEALKPFSTESRVIDSKAFSRAVSIAMQPFKRASRNASGRVLSYEEAVLGVAEFGLKGIPRKTSVGYPMSIVTGSRDKSYFFGSDMDFDLTTEEAMKLQARVEELHSKLKEGFRPFFVCRDFLKDEVRKVGKNARLIAGTSIEYYILCRMYFGSYVASLIRHHQDSGICVGMNPTSEWGWLRNFMLGPDPTGNNVWDGDFAGFDSSQVPSMLWPLLDEINDWYTVRGGSGEEARIRELLYTDLVYSKHLVSYAGEMSGTIIEWQKSLPSGHFLTSTVNSMLSMSCITSAYVGILKREDFWENAAAASLGDDNLVSVSNEFVGEYNQVTVSEYLAKEFGMKYTAGRKGEALKPTVGIDNVTFLQRRFRIKNGTVVCPIRPESFLNSMYYTKKGTWKYRREVLVSSAENALEELAMHDEKHWGPVSQKIVDALSLLDAVPAYSVADSSTYLKNVLERVPDYI